MRFGEGSDMIEHGGIKEGDFCQHFIVDTLGERGEKAGRPERKKSQ